MPFIYKITNDINDKIYIGKTLSSLEERWKEHKRDCKKRTREKRPLYSAMNKYGTEHFQIELVEETSFDELNEREQYWINYYNSYGHNGYNATFGGDGKPLFDYKEIYDLWQQGLNIPEIKEQIGCCLDTIDAALKSFQVSAQERTNRKIESCSKKIKMINKETNQVIKIFNSIAEAYAFLNKPRSSHITEVANNKRKQAYGYKWEWE